MNADLLANLKGHLGEQFKRAQPILLTGAGFSVAARNILDNNLPTGYQLKKMLWNLCFGNDSLDENSTLQDLYQIARIRRGGDLVALLTENLTVDSNSLPDLYRIFFSFPWFRCYTLNVDDLAVAVQRQFAFSRRLQMISATASKSLDRERNHNNLEIVHLNGTLEDLPDNVTFSFRQYAERASREDFWYSQLVADMMSHPIVFVGTQIDEPSMWQYVEKRYARGGRAEREMRPKSYLVTKSLSVARQACLIDYNITFVPALAEEFSKLVLEPLRTSAEIGSLFLADLHSQSDIQMNLSEVGDLAITPNERTEFLSGTEPQWSDIQSGRAIEREIDRVLAEESEKLLKSPKERGYIVITGTAGTGKSTSLKRLALRIAADGHRVGWVDQFHNPSARTIKSAMDGLNPPAVLCIDDADIYGLEISSLLSEVCNLPKKPLVIAAIRASRVDRVLNPVQLKLVPAKEIVIPLLTDTDIDSLINVLDRENRLGILTKLSKAEQRTRFSKKCGRQLLVAMIEATSGDPFEKKIVGELEQLDPESQRIYALLSIITSWRFHLTRNEILLAVGEVDNKVVNALDRLARRQIVLNVRQDIYLARHKVIAEVVMKRITQNGMLAELLSGLAYAVASQIDSNTAFGSRLFRIQQRITNHEFLLTAIGVEESRNLYGSLEPVMGTDFNFWLQRGSLEVENNNLPFAEVCLNNARGIKASDHNTQTEYAYLLFRKALDNPSGPQSEEMIDEANRLLLANIANRGKKDPHSYHVLGQNMQYWITSGIVSKSEKKAEFERIIEIVRDGRANHPKNDHLRILLENLNDEYRMMAVVVTKKVI